MIPISAPENWHVLLNHHTHNHNAPHNNVRSSYTSKVLQRSYLSNLFDFICREPKLKESFASKISQQIRTLTHVPILLQYPIMCNNFLLAGPITSFYFFYAAVVAPKRARNRFLNKTG